MDLLLQYKHALYNTHIMCLATQHNIYTNHHPKIIEIELKPN